MPFYIRFGKVALSSLGLMMSLSLFMCYIVSLQISKYIGILRSQAENIFLAGAFFGLFIGRIFYIIKNHDQIQSILGIFQIWNGGVDYYGTIIGVVIGVISLSWFYNIPILKALDITSIIGSLMLGLGYISAGLVGFGFGRPVPLAVDITPGFHFLKVFPFFYVVYSFGNIAPPSIPFYPVQFMYGAFYVLFSLGLIYYVFKNSGRFYGEAYLPGELFSIFLIYYGFLNMSIGYFSISHLAFGSINTEQVFGFLVFVIGIVILWLLKSEKLNT